MLVLVLVLDLVLVLVFLSHYFKKFKIFETLQLENFKTKIFLNDQFLQHSCNRSKTNLIDI